MTQRHEAHQPGLVIKMVPSKYRGSLKKKIKSELELTASSLSQENDYLKKTLAESRHHYSALHKLLERFLTLETVRLENCQQLKAKAVEMALPSEQLSGKEDDLFDGVSMRRKRVMPSYSSEIAEIKSKLVSVTSRCQYLENKVARNKGSISDEQASTDEVRKLQYDLKDALEKNKQWLEYDQQREAYVRAVLARMLWLEKQLNEANKARSQQHNEDYSNVNMRISQMQEHYERLLEKAKDELEVLRDRVNETCQNLTMTQNICKNKEEEVEELKQQLQSERSNKEAAECHSWSEIEEEHLTDETRDLRHRLSEEKRKSANLEFQTSIRDKFFKNLHHADQRKIADLQRQIKISSQDLEDERQDCSYLKEQMVSVLKMMQNTRGHQAKLSKREQRDCSPCKVTPPPSPPTRESRHSSPHSSMHDGSCLECPICQAQYPVSHYRELTYHLEVCQD
ncbi:centrosomal protein of 55 kDa-like [Labrus mixtus]|uniref:centrosomal protein of 55 kDa-like n=1 Tax=Labrus mixtus TaxID=508554 RepID=UPI0029C0A788|nr:centrosomal protein of 55 kDa-like [Labrus mixtus]